MTSAPPLSVRHEFTRVRPADVDRIDAADAGRPEPVVVVVLKTGHWLVLDPEVAHGIADALARSS